MKTCFIIMPITTPDSRLVEYGGDKDHFNHILKCLFIPAIKKAEFEPIPPIFEGSDNITAAIINKLETSDLVLCDMSIFNPNVFFELGIRTALNKPVCMVRDDKTLIIPFDNSGIAAHKYLSSLNAWENESQIDDLAIQVRKSEELAKGKNPLWKYFGISSVAMPAEKGGVEEKIDLLTRQMTSLLESTNNPKPPPSKAPQSELKSVENALHQELIAALYAFSHVDGFRISDIKFRGHSVKVYTTGKRISDNMREIIKTTGVRYFYNIKVIDSTVLIQGENSQP